MTAASKPATPTGALAQAISRRLLENASALKAQWNAEGRTTTRYFYIDDLLDAATARAIYEAFPKAGEHWFQRDSFRERKKTFAKLDRIEPIVAQVTDAFHLPEVVAAVQEITAIQGLEPDPELYAGGISMMGKDDFLNPHIDNSHDAVRGRYRRLNLLYYVSPEWDPKNGGNLELWDKTVRKPTEIPALFNRLIVMETDASSWHSVNQVRVDDQRCCVSNYFFSSASPTGEDYYHVTSFLGRPDQPIRRLYGHFDNFLRQQVAQRLKVSRGKHLGRVD